MQKANSIFHYTSIASSMKVRAGASNSMYADQATQTTIFYAGHVLIRYLSTCMTVQFASCENGSYDQPSTDWRTAPSRHPCLPLRPRLLLPQHQQLSDLSSGQ